ncbi:MAG TPA: M67 family metallopeptidase [Roseiflexaceae bacterium]|nr:M67 family metallopeptidase [Roseiflexaceae bacterium]HMP41989.1 M67 family metallopeptidase [Roseiflexaceae bacterium]
MIILSVAARAAIAHHAESTYPHECVGLIIGRIENDQLFGDDIITTPNRWTADIGLTDAEHEHSLRDRFYLDPRDYLRADREARSRNLDVIGVYHSHPDHPAQPSERDRTGAQGIGGDTGFVFLIQSVREATAAELTAWLLVDGGARFVETSILA